MVGTEVSKITRDPLGFKTLSISAMPVSRVSKFRTPKETVTASKELSSNTKFSLSPTTISIILLRFLSFTLSLPTANMPGEMSRPIIFLAPVLTSAMAKSPVPVAISNIDSGCSFFNISTTFLRHLMSMPNEITRFKPS